MDSKTAQNVQDTYFNTVRKDKTPLTIYLVNGVRVHGRIRSFDKFSVLLENAEQEQLVFKHAISTITTNAMGGHGEKRGPLAAFRTTVNGPGKVGEIVDKSSEGADSRTEVSSPQSLTK